MSPTLEVILSPAEFAGLSHRDLAGTVCVVFDILRATSTMVTALAHGAEAILPVSSLDEALALRRQRPEVLLGGERNGLRPPVHLTGGVEFNFGNSPREFGPGLVQGRTIVMTTTNGTRALRACAGARSILAGSFLNLRATIQWLEESRPPHLILVCAGTREEPALEDMLAAGAVCHSVWAHYLGGRISDAARMAHRLYPLYADRLLDAAADSTNGRRLLAIPELRDDVAACLQRDSINLVALMGPDGALRNQKENLARAK